MNKTFKQDPWDFYFPSVFAQWGPGINMQVRDKAAEQKMGYYFFQPLN